MRDRSVWRRHRYQDRSAPCDRPRARRLTGDLALDHDDQFITGELPGRLRLIAAIPPGRPNGTPGRGPAVAARAPVTYGDEKQMPRNRCPCGSPNYELRMGESPGWPGKRRSFVIACRCRFSGIAGGNSLQRDGALVIQAVLACCATILMIDLSSRCFAVVTRAGGPPRLQPGRVQRLCLAADPSPSFRRGERRSACGDRNPAASVGNYSVGDA
jgi:hypothetical protein